MPPRDIRDLMAEDNRNRRTSPPAPKRADPDDDVGEEEEEEEEDEDYVRKPARRPAPAREDYEQPRVKPSLFSKKKKKPSRQYDDDEYDDRRGRQIPKKKLITAPGALVLVVCLGAIVGLLISAWQYSTAGNQIQLIASLEYVHLQNAMMFFCLAMLALLTGWGK